ncbi:fucose-specific lectin [Eremomyces bilateralis CBS 781.70]|uniref:Fucose-specific lectin n=1 Tax=Eremomyces bilateralis CBS 781.70 TaxID=1392243 RepID=A0A6G1G5N3_9PEZI|nr:fucose-specific lectin [Eremomyces bilateralis CBS 781.70]KAF1813405.1 fucose-specific lectin [Eremomyces bilateralis CBS 781.70]
MVFFFGICLKSFINESCYIPSFPRQGSQNSLRIMTATTLFSLSLAILSVGRNNRHIIGWGADRGLYHSSWNGRDSTDVGTPSSCPAWNVLGGKFSSAPAAAAWGNAIDVDDDPLLSTFAVNDDGSVWHKSASADNATTWSVWETLGGVFRTDSPPAASSWARDHMSVFAVGKDDSQLYHSAHFKGRWTPWQSLGGEFASHPASVSWGSNRLDVFGIGADTGLWHRSNSGNGWEGWEPMGGAFTSPPAAVSWGQGHMCVFGVGTNKEMWYKSWAGTGWSSWQSLGGSFQSTPGAVSTGSGRMDVYGVGTDGQAWHREWRGNRWSEWETLRGSCRSAPGVATWDDGKISVICSGRQNKMVHKQWDGGKWTPEGPDWEDCGGSFMQAPPEESSAPQSTPAQEPQQIITVYETVTVTAAPGGPALTQIDSSSTTPEPTVGSGDEPESKSTTSITSFTSPDNPRSRSRIVTTTFTLSVSKVVSPADPEALFGNLE